MRKIDIKDKRLSEAFDQVLGQSPAAAQLVLGFAAGMDLKGVDRVSIVGSYKLIVDDGQVNDPRVHPEPAISDQGTGTGPQD